MSLMPSLATAKAAVTHFAFVPRAAVSGCSNRSATFQRHFKPNDASGALRARLQLRSPRSSPNRLPRAIDSNPNAVGSLATVIDAPSLDHHDQRAQFRSKGWRRSCEKTECRCHSAQSYARDETSPVNRHAAALSRSFNRCFAVTMWNAEVGPPSNGCGKKLECCCYIIGRNRNVVGLFKRTQRGPIVSVDAGQLKSFAKSLPLPA